jgi:hypothetical protein
MQLDIGKKQAFFASFQTRSTALSPPHMKNLFSFYGNRSELTGIRLPDDRNCKLRAVCGTAFLWEGPHD